MNYVLTKQLRHSVPLIKKISHFVFPPTCILCHGPSENIDLCAHCLTYCHRAPYRCYQCALPLASATTTPCGTCLKKEPLYQRSITLFDYAEPIAELLNQLKFHQRLVNARVLGELMAEHVKKNYVAVKQPECIIPVPLHSARLKERGFNQTLELAYPIARKLNMLIENTLLERRIDTQQQSLLSAADRRRNLRGAFIAHSAPYKHIALLDDVVTTGSTIHACCEALQKVGVEQIDIWSIARTDI